MQSRRAIALKFELNSQVSARGRRCATESSQVEVRSISSKSRRRLPRPLLGARQSQHGVDQFFETLDVFQRSFDPVPIFFRGVRPLDEGLKRRFDDCHRRFQLVCGIRQELTLRREGLADTW